MTEPEDRAVLRGREPRKVAISLAFAIAAIFAAGVVHARVPGTEGVVLGVALLVAAWMGRTICIECLPERRPKDDAGQD